MRRAGGFFFGAEKSVAAIFFQQKREPDNFWVYLFLQKGFLRLDLEDSFRVRSSSICLDLRLDLPIILFTIFG